MFVLLRAYELTASSLSIQERMALTMERGGLSIMFTSITDLLAFCVGATSVFGSISAFCVYCGVGVFLDFVFQVSFFLAFMVYDSRYQDTNSLKSCWNKSDNDDPEAPNYSLIGINSDSEVDLETKQSRKPSRKYSHLLEPLNPPESTSFLMDKLASILLSSIWVKIGVLLLFCGYLVGATFGVLQLTAYQNPEDLAPNDSYLRNVYDSYERYFNSIGASIEFILDKSLDYNDIDTIYNVNNMINTIRNDECFLNDSAYTTSWLTAYNQYLMQYYAESVTNLNQSEFYEILYNEYLVSTNGETYIQDIWNTIITHEKGFEVINKTDIFSPDVIGENSYKAIDKSRFYLSLKPTTVGTEGIKECLDNFKRLQDEFSDDLGTYYYAYFTVFAESDLVTIQQTIYNLLYACIAASIITIILIPYPLMAIFVMTTVAQILFGVLGYMSLWGLPINTTTMINVVISVGFSVDNSAHFCHSFMNAPISLKFKSKSEERKARVIYALNAVGMPILAGDLSTIVALLPLSTAESEIFLSFWKCISLVMMFGISYAVLYLPVVLSICGPLGFDDIVNDESDNVIMDGYENHVHDEDEKVQMGQQNKYSNDQTNYTLLH